MPRYKASNYSMGRAVKTVEINASTHSEAMREAERLMPTANGLPGTHPQAAAKSRVIGVKLIG
jgi:hypothetical protein